MREPEIPANDADRVKALTDLNIVYTPAEERFDRITRIATRVFDIPIALVSLVTHDSQWFKSCQGLTVSETDRRISFCGHAILSDEVFVIPNALKDPDFRDNPLVTGSPNIRFYAGQPIHLGDHRIGTLCIIDQKPRHMSPKDFDSLTSLGKWVESELQLWHGKSNALLRKILSTNERGSLIDPITGSLTEAGLRMVEINAADQNGQGNPPASFTLQIANLERIEDKERVNLLRKEIAQTMRARLNDRGILGLSGNNTFTVVLSADQVDTAGILAERMQTDVESLLSQLSVTGLELNVSTRANPG